MSEHAVVIAGGGPAGMMLAAELALAKVDVAVVERRPDHVLAGSRAGGLHSRTIELFDQRAVADRFLAEGQVVQVARFGTAVLDMSDFPTRHPYSLGIWQNEIEQIMAAWISELPVRIHYGREVMGFTQDDSGVEVECSDGRSLRAQYLVGCDGGRSLIRKAAGIEFPGWDASRSNLIAEVEMTEEPELGIRNDALGMHALGRLEYEIRDGEVIYKDEGPVRVMVTEPQVRASSEPTLRDLSEGLIAVYGTDFGIHSPTWISRFSDMTRQAAAYRAGRVLLAGDSAHVHSPAGGQGLGEGHPLLGRRMPDLDLLTADGPLRVFELLHYAKPVLLNLGEPDSFDITHWADRVQLVDAEYAGLWELPVLGEVPAPTAVLIRPDGYVAWVSDGTDTGLRDALTRWFGAPNAA
jgi:2-polyprenyl-6-methoxyphenol hydroxylase-like FAD-dependent oxidoreductase